MLGLLAPLLQTKIGWNELQYGYIVTAFQVAYALGLLIMGRFIDRVGTRIGYAAAIGIWSLSAMAHSIVHSALGFGVARFALGFGESGNFPAAIKTIAEWFPKKERALATGIFNSGTNVGATVAPLPFPGSRSTWDGDLRSYYRPLQCDLDRLLAGGLSQALGASQNISAGISLHSQ